MCIHTLSCLALRRKSLTRFSKVKEAISPKLSLTSNSVILNSSCLFPSLFSKHKFFGA